jgi:hypothetical protein
MIAAGANVVEQVKRDPEFEKIAPLMHDLAEATFSREIVETPEAVAANFPASYERAVALRQAREDALLDLPFDEAHHIQRLGDDRTGTLPPWDKEEAYERLVAERLKFNKPLGQIAAERLDGWSEREERQKADWDAAMQERVRSNLELEDTAQAYARAKAANDEHERHTGRRRLR